MEPSYTLRKSKRARRMRLAVYCDGSVVVTAPVDAAMGLVERFIADKKQWILSKIKYFQKADRRLIRAGSKEDYQKHKDQALQVVTGRVEHFSRIYGFTYNRITIKNQKTRWGSCSTRKNLNINYKVLFLPDELRDYVIVHELCHLKEMNHSRKFWNLVQKALPDYLDVKKRLKGQMML